MLSTIISVFLIPLLIGISSWAERLLDIASGLSPSSFISPDTDSPESLSDPGAPPSEAAADQKADRKSYLQQHLPLIKIILTHSSGGAIVFFNSAVVGHRPAGGQDIYIHRPEHHGVAAAGYCCLAIYQSPH